MPPLRWSVASSVFLPEIDAEHRSLFRLANAAHAAFLKGVPDARVHEALQAFTAELDEHLSHEERLMRSTGYEIYRWHKAQHDNLRRRVKKAIAKFAAGDREAVPTLLEQLNSWFRDHTGITDRMLGAFLRNRERSQSAAS
jgi:hemerythrin-like metal-binding protein